MPGTWLQPLVLEGRHVRLEPLGLHHLEDLQEAVSDGDLWNLWYTPIAPPEGMAAEIQRRLDLQARGLWLPFAVREARTGQVAGMTAYLNVEEEHRRLEIGGTWIRRSLQRTGLNTEAKRLLLAHAFEALDCIAVELRTSFYNHASRRAIERLGAHLDGILRHHRRTHGHLRDTCVYSIVAPEWPTVRTHLDHLLEPGGSGR